jgi:hypothetical protein
MMPSCHVNVFAVTLDFSVTGIEGFFKELVESGKRNLCFG